MDIIVVTHLVRGVYWVWLVYEELGRSWFFEISKARLGCTR